VNSIIEGSVRKALNKVRISVQLIDTRSEEYLWSASYDQELSNIFKVQTEVGMKVAEALEMKFVPNTIEREFLGIV
jgi:TolB-like protein